MINIIDTQKLQRNFYLQSTRQIAHKLLGKLLVHRLANNLELSGRIVETEAYLGVKDPACHTFNGKKTRRNSSMYLEGGHAYIYFVYGMYYCFNVVTKSSRDPEAILIRALEPVAGIEFMRQLRNNLPIKQITNGPGKLCQAMQLDKTLDGTDLTGSQVFILNDNFKIKPQQIQRAPRIGIDYAGEAAQWPLRYFIRDNPYVSVR